MDLTADDEAWVTKMKADLRSLMAQCPSGVSADDFLSMRLGALTLAFKAELHKAGWHTTKCRQACNLPDLHRRAVAVSEMLTMAVEYYRPKTPDGSGLAQTMPTAPSAEAEPKGDWI